jgi:hypothetical protein
VSWRHAGKESGGGRPARTPQPTALVAHPSSRADGITALSVAVARAPAALTLTYRLHGELAGYVIPPPGPIRLGHDLWRHTCFEAFIAATDAAAYCELNVAPSRAWALHAFRAYRDGGPIASPTWVPRIEVTARPAALAVRVALPLDALAPGYAAAPLRLALAAVLEARDGGLSYWALRHPPGAPDFHHPDGFALTLEPPAGAC